MIVENKGDWYVYRHVRLDKNQPFYIGIGCKEEYGRAYENHKSKRNIIWSRITDKSEYRVDILFDELSKEDASEKEQEFISLYGRLDLGLGPLCNMTDGGDGIWGNVGSEETRAKLRACRLGDKNPMFGKKQSKETIEKRVVKLKGKRRSKETCKKLSLASISSGQANETSVYDYETKEFVGKYYSMSEACRSLGLGVSSNSKASMVARGLRYQHKGYIFRYGDDPVDKFPYEGSITKNWKDKVSNSKFTKEQVLSLYDRLKAGEGRRSLAREFGVGRQVMQNIINGTSFKQWLSDKRQKQ